MNNVLLATSMPIFAAYGDRSKPLASTNVKLTASVAGWMLADELMDRFLTKGRAGKTFAKGANLVSYAAPIGNYFTAKWLVGDLQHQRFITDSITLSGSDLTNSTPITFAEDSKTDLSGKALPALATITNTGGRTSVEGVTASVSGGEITVTLLGAEGSGDVTVAWVVDTQVGTT